MSKYIVRDIISKVALDEFDNPCDTIELALTDPLTYEIVIIRFSPAKKITINFKIEKENN